MGCKDVLRDLYHVKDILIVICAPIVLIPFLVVDGGGPVSVLISYNNERSGSLMFCFESL